MSCSRKFAVCYKLLTKAQKCTNKNNFSINFDFFIDRNSSRYR